MSLAMAADATATADTTGASVSVDTQIAEIQAAPAQKRVKLMNQFKMRLANMNEAERSEAIAQMQAAMQAKENTAITVNDTVAQERTQTHTRTQTRAQNMQMQASQESVQMQNMNQERTGSQFMNMPGNGPAATATPSANAGSGSHNVNFSMPRGH